MRLKIAVAVGLLLAALPLLHPLLASSISGGGGGGGGASVVTCCYRLTANQSVADQTATSLAGWTQVYDSSSTPFYNAGTSTTNFVIPVTAKYVVQVQIAYAFNTTGSRYARVHKNGSYWANIGNENAVADIGNSDTMVNASTVMSLSAGDTLTIDAFHNAGAPLNVEAGTPGVSSAMTIVCITSLPVTGLSSTTLGSALTWNLGGTYGYSSPELIGPNDQGTFLEGVSTPGLVVGAPSAGNFTHWRPGVGLSSGVAHTLETFQLPRAAGFAEGKGWTIRYTLTAEDTNSHNCQLIRGAWHGAAVVDFNGTLTTDGQAAGTTAVANSSGTLSIAFSTTLVGSVFSIKATGTSSFSPASSMNLSYIFEADSIYSDPTH